MCKEEFTKSVKRLFDIDVIVMGVLFSVLGWTSLEIMGNNEVLAALQEKHVSIDKDSKTIEETSKTVLRMELNQTHYNESINKDITHIKESLTILSKRVDSATP